MLRSRRGAILILSFIGFFMALPFLAGKSLNAKGTKYTKVEKSLDFFGFFLRDRCVL